MKPMLQPGHEQKEEGRDRQRNSWIVPVKRKQKKKKRARSPGS